MNGQGGVNWAYECLKLSSVLISKLYYYGLVEAPVLHFAQHNVLDIFLDTSARKMDTLQGFTRRMVSPHKTQTWSS
jgi:hypothetical protein